MMQLGRERTGSPSSLPLRWLDRADHRLGTPLARVVAVLLVLGTAALLRWIYLAQVSETHGFGRPIVDSRGYDLQARALLAGEWPGGEVFFVDPLYSYILAGHYALFGPGQLGVAVMQMVLGIATVALVYRLAASFLRPTEALLAGLLAASYGVFFFYEALILKAAPAVFLVTAILLALVHSRGRGPLASGLSGVLLGIGILLRGNLLALLPLGCIWLAWASTNGGRPSARLGRALAFVAGVALSIAPVTLHNLQAGDRVLITSNAGQNFYVGNGPHNETGSYVPPPGVRASPLYEEADFRRLAEEDAGRSLAPSEVSRFWFRQAFDFIRADPERAWWLLKRKLLLAVNHVEVPDNANFGWTQGEVPLLRAPWPTFSSLLILATAALCLRRWSPEVLFLLGAIVTIAATLVAFFVTSRLRLTAVPALIVLAAALLGGVAECLAARRRLRLALAAILATLAVLVTQADVYDTSRTMLFYNHAALAVEEGDLVLAGEYVEASLSEDPRNWQARLLLGRVLSQRGRPEEAERELVEATRLAPKKPEAHFQLALLLAGRNELERAGKSLAAVLALDPQHDGAIIQLADVERRTGRRAAARARLLDLLERRPGKASALNVLGVIYVDERRLPEAQQALADAVRRRPENVRFRLNLARCYRLQGDDEAAAALYDAILSEHPENPEAQQGRRAVVGSG